MLLSLLFLSMLGYMNVQGVLAQNRTIPSIITVIFICSIFNC